MNIYKEIKKDPLIIKFSFYGLLKNLKFFEPYLLIYLFSFQITLFQIGILYAIREAITYIFEIPSGIIADHYGRKNELMLCFIFYIISFTFFFIGNAFIYFVIAMMFFGLGEAFRSGTHKAMILAYLERRNWFELKSFVYSRTRSFSLIGSSISSFLSILLIINIPSTRWIFLMTIVPYLLDFFLILSYPNYLNEQIVSKFNFIEFINIFKDSLKSIFKQKFLLKTVISSSSYDAIFRSMKDYIQAILLLLLVTESEIRIKIYLGIIYGVFYIFSSLSAKNVYRLTNRYSTIKLMNQSFIIQSLGLLIIAISIIFRLPYITIIIFFVLYVLKDARVPIFVDLSSDYMNKSERATVLSLENQFGSVFVIIIAPLFGYLSDTFGLPVAFICLGIFSLLLSSIIALKKKIN
ncbi:MAG: MFS transporter [Clostridiales bacterium]|nr:MFS transporter [Clostridiales bacterium]